LDDLKRPSPNTLAAFYESLADMFAAAGGQDVAALPALRKLPSPNAPTPVPATATNIGR
jgi:hypothetical protein